MFKSLIYKEWLKTRWFLIGYLILGLIAVAYIFLKVQHDITFYDGKNYWNNILFMNYSYFSAFKFIPLIGGVAIGIAQYFPETVDKRIKLSFHLPMKEINMLLGMVSYGTIVLTTVYTGLFALFVGLSSLFFPAEIINTSLSSILPWFLGGYAAYFFIGLIVMEPIWRFRLIYILMAAFFVTFYLKPAIAGAYAPLNSSLIGVTAVLSISLLFSAYRFRKGEQ